MTSNLALLGLQESPTLGQIRAAYIAAVKAHHPDLARGELDRCRRTRETAALNVAYAELRSRTVGDESPVPDPPSQWTRARQTPDPRQTRRVDLSTFRLALPHDVWPWLFRLVGAICFGLTASSVAGNPILCVAVFLAVSFVARDMTLRSAL